MDRDSFNMGGGGYFGTDNLGDGLRVPAWLEDEPPFHNTRSPAGFQQPIPDYHASFPSNALEWRSNGMPSEADTAPGDSGYGSARPPNLDPMEQASPYTKPSPTFFADDVGDQLFHLNMSEEHTIQNQNDQVDQQQFQYLSPPQNYPRQNSFMYQQQAQQQTHPQYQSQEHPPLQQFQSATRLKQERNSRSVDNAGFWCPSCNKAVKTRSELKKHEDRHTLPYSCSEPGCKRGGKGFASANDLDRHRATVHQQHGLAKMYQCHLGQCSKKDKPWARADNFRQHLIRIHGKEPDTSLSSFVVSHPVPQPVGEQASGIESHHSPRIAITEAPNVESNAGPRQLRPDSAHDNHLLGASPSTAYGSLPNMTTWMQGPAPPVGLRRKLSEDFQPGLSFPQSHQSNPGTNLLEEQTGSSFMGQWRDETSSPAFRFDDDDQQGPPEQQQPSPLSDNTAESDEMSPGNFIDDLVETLTTLPKSELKRRLNKLPNREVLKTLAASSDDTGRDPSSGASSAKSKCTQCRKEFKRPCELKKHMRRHDRPYCCTMNCSKRFGSKNDWKRHEGGQHEIKELWHCDLGCKKLFSDRQALEAHLGSVHEDVSKASVEEKLNDNRTGLHMKPSYWCGFCVMMMTVEPGKKCDAERADHIDGHFMGRGKFEPATMEQWKRLEDHFEDTSGKRKREDEDTAGGSRPAKQPHKTRT